jgi:hypothetical protein
MGGEGSVLNAQRTGSATPAALTVTPANCSELKLGVWSDQTQMPQPAAKDDGSIGHPKEQAMDTIRNESMIKLALDTIELMILRWQVDEAMSNP